MGKAAQGLQASERLAAFFSRESFSLVNELDAHADDDSDGLKSAKLNQWRRDDVLLRVTDGTFTVGYSPPSSAASEPEVDGKRSTSDLALTEHPLEGGEESPTNQTLNLARDSGVDKTSFTVSGVNLVLRRSEILCIVGPVASGKTTLIRGIIGDLSLPHPSSSPASPESASSTSSSSCVAGGRRIAYASQTPFILNATVRDNVLFGSDYDARRFEAAVEACSLLPDLEALGPARDLTEIGERGVTLSGGQRARISLARVAYARPDVAVFDDPLSALDASTAGRVFERLFEGGGGDDGDAGGRGGPLGESAVVLVTHASHLLRRADRILVLAGGRQAFEGTWDELGAADTSRMGPAAREAVESILGSVQEDGSSSGRDGGGAAAAGGG